MRMGGGTMDVYGFNECAAVYVTFPVETRSFSCNLPISHLVKLLRNPGTENNVHLGFSYDHLRVTCGVMQHKVKYVNKPIPDVKYPTVRPAARYEVKLPVLKQFLRMASDEVVLHQSHGLCLKSTTDGMVESSVHFPTYNDPLLTLFNIPLLCTEPWPEGCKYSTVFLSQLSKVHSFTSEGVLVVCVNHLVFTGWREDVKVRICFTSKC